MQLTNVPFNLDLIEDPSTSLAGLVEVSSDGLLPVKSGQIFSNGVGEFDPAGLYSNLIFGKQGKKERYRTLAYINLKVRVFHPLYYKKLIRTKSLYKEILDRTAFAVWDEEEKDFVRSNVLDGSNGYSFFLSHFYDIVFKRTESGQRDLNVNFLEKYRKKCLISRLIVVPAGLRDIEVEDGHPKEDEINGMYRKLISINKTINERLIDLDDPILDSVRNNITFRVLDIYEYIFNITKGKKGFLKGKVASRRVSNSTRNVLTSQNVGARKLGAKNSPGLHTTQIGIYQYIKGIEPLLVNHHMQNSFMRNFFDNLNGDCPVIDKKTLKAITIQLSNKAEKDWSGADGINGIINAYDDSKRRNEPVMVDDNYVKLIYRDNEKFLVLSTIDELPKGYDIKKVTPMNWSEFFYILSAPLVNRTRIINTRHPVLELGSIYPSNIQLLSNTTAKELYQVDLDGNRMEGEFPFFPSLNDNGYFESMTVSPFRLAGLGADFDGDILSGLIVFINESVASIDKHMADLSAYIDPAGGTYIPYTTDLLDWVLSFTTGDE
jgi:hypothetical protein